MPNADTEDSLDRLARIIEIASLKLKKFLCAEDADVYVFSVPVPGGPYPEEDRSLRLKYSRESGLLGAIVDYSNCGELSKTIESKPLQQWQVAYRVAAAEKIPDLFAEAKKHERALELNVAEIIDDVEHFLSEQ